MHGQCTETSWMKTCSRALLTSDWGDSSSFSRTTTLSTQPRYQRSGFRTTLWMSLSGPARAQTWIRLNISGELENGCAPTLPIQHSHDGAWEEWAKLPKDNCAKLVASYSKISEAVIAAKGASTKYKRRCGSGGKSCRLAVGGLLVRSHPGRVEVSLSKTPNPQLLLTSWLVPCMAANRRWCVNGWMGEWVNGWMGERVNERHNCKALWIKALYKCSPFTIYHLLSKGCEYLCTCDFLVFYF